MNDVAWSPSGKFCAGVSHDSQVHIINTQDLSKLSCQSIQWKTRPFCRLCFSSDEEFFCCGYDRVPVQYLAKGNDFAEKATLDEVNTKARTLGYLEQKISIFEGPKLGRSTEDIEYLTIPKTKHKNTIMYHSWENNTAG